MEWTRAHRAYMWELIKNPEGIHQRMLARHIAKELEESGYITRDRKTGIILPTPFGKRAWREGRAL
jgi:DNA-binding HxlR family transcriptional regulator